MYDSFGKWLMRRRIRAVLPHLDGSLLDIGCGTNQLKAAYSGDGIGVDVFPWHGVDKVVEDTADLPWDDGTFDCVTIVAALNHIPQRQAVLDEAFRVLADGGRLIITMIPPTLSRIWHLLRSPWDVDQIERGMAEGEVFGLTRDQVHRLIRESGFELVSESRFMLGINRLTVARKPEPPAVEG